MSVSIWVNRKNIYLSVYENGQRKRESTGLTLCGDKDVDKKTMELAEVLKAKRQVALVAQINGILDPKMKDIRLIDYAEIMNKRKGKRTNLHKMIFILKKWNENPKMSSLNPAWFDEIKDRIMEEDLAGSTQDCYLATLRTLFKIALRDGVILKDPAVGITHIPYEEETKDVLSVDEIKTLIDTPLGGLLGGDIKKAFLFCCYTGFRISDAKRLTWEMYDRGNNKIARTMKKTRNAVYIPLNETAKAIIDADKDHEPGYIFPHLQVSTSNTDRYFRRWEKNSKIKKHLSWHVSRYTNANLLFDSGADIYTVQRFLGHKKVQTTERYAKVSDLKKVEAAEKLPNLTDDIIKMKNTVTV